MAPHRTWLHVTAALCGTAAAATTARAESPDLPVVSDGATAATPALRTADLGLTRRADAPGLLAGSVAFAAQSGAPGHVDPDASMRIQLGLGHGLVAEVDATRAGIDGRFRPGVGLKWQIAGAADRPLSMAVVGLYKPEGFSEPEGELELQYLCSLHLTRTELDLNLVAGGDPDLRESDLEAHVAGGYRLGRRVVVGGEARSRVGLGSKHDGYGRQEHVIGPMAQIAIGRVLASGFVGAGALETWGAPALRFGAYGVGRLAFTF